MEQSRARAAWPSAWQDGHPRHRRAAGRLSADGQTDGGPEAMLGSRGSVSWVVGRSRPGGRF